MKTKITDSIVLFFTFYRIFKVYDSKFGWIRMLFINRHHFADVFDRQFTINYLSREPSIDRGII